MVEISVAADEHQPVTTTSSSSPAQSRRIMFVVCLALATVVSAVSSLNVALPSIARATHAGQTELAWVVDAYALVFAALLLPAGAIGDRFGRRRALTIGLVLFGVGSGAAMLFSSAHWLIAMRAVLGLGAALVMPATLSTITSTFPAQRRARAVGAWAGVAGASAVLGLLTSGLVLQAWSWRSVFLLNVVLATAALIGTVTSVPESADPDAPKLDTVGAVITVAGLGAIVYSIIEAPTAGWLSVRTVAGLIAGLIAMGAFVLWELRTDHPLLDPALFRLRGFTAGSLTVTLQFFAFFGLIFLMLQYLQLVLGNSPLRAALSMLPLAAGLMPFARVIAPRAASRIGSIRTSATGLAIAAAGLAWLSQLDATSPYWQLFAGLIPLGAGMGLAMTPATVAITDALPAEQQGVGSAVNDLSRELGGALGIAVAASIAQSVYRSRLRVGGLPADLADRVRASFAVAAHLGQPVAGYADSAFVDGMRAALLTGSAVLIAAAVAVAVIGAATPDPVSAQTSRQ
jgi:EmrB/QacA subfamily drug resistance transporter